MYKISTLQDFINYKRDSYYGFDGLHNSNIKVPPCPIYKLYAEDFYFNEKENALILNLGNYHDKKIDYLLKDLFVPKNELCFDLAEHIKSMNIRLILNNTIANLDDNFFSTVYTFFEKMNLTPTYTGIWRK